MVHITVLCSAPSGCSVVCAGTFANMFMPPCSAISLFMTRHNNALVTQRLHMINSNAFAGVNSVGRTNCQRWRSSACVGDSAIAFESLLAAVGSPRAIPEGAHSQQRKEAAAVSSTRSYARVPLLNRPWWHLYRCVRRGNKPLHVHACSNSRGNQPLPTAC